VGALTVVTLVAVVLVVTGSASQAAGGTVFTWHMDETSGTTMVDSTGGQNGTMKDVVLNRPGIKGTGYGFNGTSSRVIVPTDDSLNPYDADVHISFYLRTTTVPAQPDYDLFRKGEAPGQEYKVEMQPNGQASCDFRGSNTTYTEQAGPDLSDGQWHHIECNKTSDTVSLVVDGTTYSRSKVIGSISNTYNVVVGAYPSGDYYQGDLDEVTLEIGARTVVAPTASFTASPSSGPAPLTVHFTDTSSGSPSQWGWDFGDGTTSTAQNPTHTYNQPGSYPVTLKVTNGAGSDTASRTITAQAVAAPQASFTMTPSSGPAPLTVHFTDTSSGSPTQWAWDFGDGTASTQQSPSHSYDKPGSYPVTLKVTNAGGSDTVSHTVTAQVAVPQASFTMTPSSGSAPLAVHFTDTSSGSPTQWAWDFGDGTTSTAQNPSHTYDKPGSYQVNLTVRNTAGSSTASHSLAVGDDTAPQGRYALSAPDAWAGWTTTVLSQQALSDDGTPTDRIARLVDWGDGTAPLDWTSGDRLDHVYRTSGSYAPTVTLTDLSGNRATVTLPAVAVRVDDIAPTVRLDVPTARHRVSDWRHLRGTVRDGQSGAARVLVKAVEKRGAHWYAYRPGTRTWARAGSRAAAWRHAGWLSIRPDGRLWDCSLAGLHRGTLELQLTARDHAGNQSPVHRYGYRLTRR
jgi:PKD repeat protein